MNKPQNPATRIITGKVRFSYAHLFEPRASAEGAEPRYSLCVLIDKSDKETLAKAAQLVSDPVGLLSDHFCFQGPGQDRQVLEAEDRRVGSKVMGLPGEGGATGPRHDGTLSVR